MGQQHPRRCSFVCYQQEEEKGKDIDNMVLCMLWSLNSKIYENRRDTHHNIRVCKGGDGWESWHRYYMRKPSDIKHIEPPWICQVRSVLNSLSFCIYIYMMLLLSSSLSLCWKRNSWKEVSLQITSQSHSLSYLSYFYFISPISISCSLLDFRFLEI